VGGASGRTEFSDPTGNNFAPQGEVTNVRVGGVIGGGQAGCDYQFAPNWVAGLEADFSFADVKGKGISDDPVFGHKNLLTKTHGLATATGRLGYAVDGTLFYAKGGAAWARDRFDITTIPSPGFTDWTAVKTRTGWTAGFGIEGVIRDNWSVKFEFDHYDLGTRNVALIAADDTRKDAIIKQQVNAVKIGINYRFGTPAVVGSPY